jgi:hypothetical protein
VGEICKEQSGETYIKCYSEHFTKELLNVQSLQTRMKSQNETIVAKSREFQAKYSPRPEPDQPNIILDTSSPDSWELHYLENLPFDSHGNRMFGANVSHLEKSGKFLHQVWGEALNDMCKSKVRTNRQVYIHNAYVFLPGNLFGTILDMTTSGGALDCENVTIKVITNSFYSTDLNPINLLNDIMVAKLFTQYKQDRNHQKVASLNYYEYLPHNIEEAIESRKQGLSGHSLHSKVNVFGDDVMIGSANADPRSMMMDANNGIYIRNAPHLAYHYSHWLDEKIGDSNQIVDLTESYLNKTVAEVEQESHERLDQLVAQYEHIEFIGKYKPRIREFYSALIKFSTSCGKSTIFDLETMSDPFGSFNPDPKIRPNDCSFNKFNLRLKAF